MFLVLFFYFIFHFFSFLICTFEIFVLVLMHRMCMGTSKVDSLADGLILSYRMPGGGL